MVCNCFCSRNRSSQMFLKIGVLKNFENFTGKNLCWSLFLIKFQAYGLQIYYKETPNFLFELWFQVCQNLTEMYRFLSKRWHHCPSLPTISFNRFRRKITWRRVSASLFLFQLSHWQCFYQSWKKFCCIDSSEF